MTRIVDLPPANGLRPDGTLLGGWWHDDPEQGRIVCDLCPRECHLKPGDRGFCFVRENVDGQMVLTTYGRSTGFCIDPIEKKPLNHFYPGTSVLSFGTAGCNLGCKFCQNWDISKSREVERLSELAMPDAIAQAAQQAGSYSVAFTYNDPVIWAEYAIDTAKACHAVGLKTVAVTAGYITPQARGPFYEHMDAANVDLKGFTEDFYYKVTYSHLQPVLETLEWLHRETDVWFEITNLIIPRTNDSPDDLRRMCDWILQHCGDAVPVHFTAFHPDFRMLDLPNTPHETLLMAHELGRKAGIKYVYTGNVDDPKHQSTYCPHCNRQVIERNWYELGAYELIGNTCRHCGGVVAGRFADRPGNWGRKRLPVTISRVPATESPARRASENKMSMSRTDSPPSGVSQRPMLSAEQQTVIQLAANSMIAADVVGRRLELPDPELAGAARLTVMGVFVTLKRQGRLRACCGMLGQPMLLFDALRQAARRTATEDHRLPTISPTELPYLELDVSLLYNFQPITARGRDRIGAVQVGRHGLQIRRGSEGGLLLPSVPVENGWDAETFLRQVCRKANLPSTAWMDDQAQLISFESIAFGGPFDAKVLLPGDVEPRPLCTDAQVAQLAAHARQNILTLTDGGTPNYYWFDVPDGTVSGVALVVRVPNLERPLEVGNLSLRPGVPLQATLSQLCDSVAKSLRNAGLHAAQLDTATVDVTILTDPAMHGSVAEPELGGLDPRRRALLILESGRSVWSFEPSRTADELLHHAVRELRVVDPEAASLFSFDARSSDRSLLLNTSPRAATGRSVRPAAVAGSFYPADPTELARLVESQLGASQRRAEQWPAVMVPHAGLVYSGRLAAATFNRVEFPEVIIVIGPKHTRHGVPWSVAPNSEWDIPGHRLAADPRLARQLVEAMPGLELDAAAHQQEHGIEVELPFLARLAPQSRIVGIAIGGGGLAKMQEFAEGLAKVIRGQARRPLLVISSDMNHFATDSENRRLDELALRAMETLDPAQLFDVCTTNDISMCGMLPAVLIMQTLKLLGGLNTCERVGYATSADVSGDKSRVVGYAGMLLR